jgi:retron-type reverse transcriptase
VSWVLDADIRGFFDAIDHEWLVKFVEHRIADQRIERTTWGVQAGELVLAFGREASSDKFRDTHLLRPAP